MKKPFARIEVVLRGGDASMGWFCDTYDIIVGKSLKIDNNTSKQEAQKLADRINEELEHYLKY